MTKTKFLSLLATCKFNEYPILEQVERRNYIDLFLCRDDMRLLPPIHKFDMRMSGANARLTEHWVRYNRWLDRWYSANSPGSHLSGYNEHKTTLRASGMSDERIDKCINKEHNKMADGNLKSKTTKLVGEIIKQMEEHIEEEVGEVTDERVEYLLQLIEEALHEAHALGVVAGRDEGL